MSAVGWGRAERLAGPHDQDLSPLSPTANMDDFTTRTYGTGTLDNRPLFGETSARDRIVNLAVGGFTSLLVMVTIISSFLFPASPPRALNIFFSVCIVMICSSVLILIFWYRQGDLEPKFRKLIYYSISSVVLLCLCANLYFHDVGR
ncbi:transmembrane protein 243 [Chanos chanos]|uniref:Transmembrane protein 243 n=1 Tax=Chanos chanos TaxID=29144 RepID=A0A6J2WLS0_CHACN|nr:transmembrane protein 243-like [Chanos chanos]